MMSVCYRRIQLCNVLGGTNLAAVDPVGRDRTTVDTRLSTGSSIARLLNLVPESLHFPRYESASLLLIVPCVGHGARHVPKSGHLGLEKSSDDASSQDTTEYCPPKYEYDVQNSLGVHESRLLAILRMYSE
jgi:hypothetical protein